MRGSDGIHHSVPHSGFLPSYEVAIVRSGCRDISLWQVAPRRTGSQHPEDAVQYATIIDTRNASRFVRQQWLDHEPLKIGQIISAHAAAESELRSLVKVAISGSYA